jgi:hypothetical protein
MEHSLAAEYGLTTHELLDALNKRFRAKVALEGAVAEEQMEKHIRALKGSLITRYAVHDQDAHPDFSIWVPGRETAILAECKNVLKKPKTARGTIVCYQVETQKTRSAKGVPNSRLYDVDKFEILGVCLGKLSGNWTDFVFAVMSELKQHAVHEGKLATHQDIPLICQDRASDRVEDTGVWFRDLGELLRKHYVGQI